MEATSTLPIIVLNELIGNPVPHLNLIQTALVPYTTALVIFWWFLWWMTALALLRYLYVHGVRKGDLRDRELYSHTSSDQYRADE